jgi:hypothetical protein
VQTSSPRYAARLRRVWARLGDAGGETYRPNLAVAERQGQHQALTNDHRQGPPHRDQPVTQSPAEAPHLRRHLNVTPATSPAPLSKTLSRGVSLGQGARNGGEVRRHSILLSRPVSVTGLVTLATVRRTCTGGINRAESHFSGLACNDRSPGTRWRRDADVGHMDESTLGSFVQPGLGAPGGQRGCCQFASASADHNIALWDVGGPDS